MPEEPEVLGVPEPLWHGFATPEHLAESLVREVSGIITDRLDTEGAAFVAFPGGRRDPEDRDLVDTALREAEEEIGLPPGLVEVVGPLSSLVSRHGIQVTPYVGLVPDYVEYKANDAEIASVFSVPLEFFRSDPREMTHRIDYLGQSWYVPSYTYGEYRIWGLTAIMVVELVNLLFDDAQIALHQPPEHFIHLR